MESNKIIFLILGITGDLSNKKILPSIGFLSSIYPDTSFEIIGLSRSDPDVEKINKSLSSLSNHNIKKINFLKSEYTDLETKKIIKHYSQTCSKLVIYLALPPFLILKFLKGLENYTNNNSIFIFEKPFGIDKEDALNILKYIDENNLGEYIKFFDHYLYKEGLNISFIKIPKIKIKNIKIVIKEEIGVKGRQGYYDTTGAIKDIIPSHIYALLDRVYKLYSLNLDIKNIVINNVKIAQYKGYLEDLNLDKSNTETYFLINCYDKFNDIKIALESGKKLKFKQTYIKIKGINKKIKWQIYPIPFFKINNKKIFINTTNKPEHAIMFEDIIFNKMSENKFFTNKEIIEGWDLYEKIKSFIKINEIQIELY